MSNLAYCTCKLVAIAGVIIAYFVEYRLEFKVIIPYYAYTIVQVYHDFLPNILKEFSQ